MLFSGHPIRSATLLWLPRGKDRGYQSCLVSHVRVENWVLLYRLEVIDVLWAHMWYYVCVYMCIYIFINRANIYVWHICFYTSVRNECARKYRSDFRVLIASILRNQWNLRSPCAFQDVLCILQNWASAEHVLFAVIQIIKKSSEVGSLHKWTRRVHNEIRKNGFWGAEKTGNFRIKASQRYGHSFCYQNQLRQWFLPEEMVKQIY